jgi:glycosyltransferase involved in cell wall biosynthesis
MPPNNFALYGKFNGMVERCIAYNANMVVFTNQSTANTYLLNNICPAEKLYVIPHLVDIQRMYTGNKFPRNIALKDPRHKETIKLLYVGGFHKGIREPYFLYDVIQKLNNRTNIEFILSIYGPSNGFDLSPKDHLNIRYMGMVSREKAFELIQKADILVNVDNSNCVMSPSKIVEYIASGRPLLNISSNGKIHPTVSKYIEYGFAYDLTSNIPISENLDATLNFLSRTTGTVAPRQVIERVLDGHDLASVASQYITQAITRKL